MLRIVLPVPDVPAGLVMATAVFHRRINNISPKDSRVRQGLEERKFEYLNVHKRSGKSLI